MPAPFRSVWPALAWAVVMLALAGIPGDYFPRTISFRDWLGPDKFVHLAMFGIFAFLLLAGPVQQYFARFNRFLVGVFVLVIGTIFGFVLEALQRFVFIGRNGNIYDLAAGLLGLLVGIVVFNIFFDRKGRADTK